MKDTIEKLIKLGLFDNFKKAMEILVKETDKPRTEWDINKLNFEGLKYKDEYSWVPESRINDRDCRYGCQNCGLNFGCVEWHLYRFYKGPKHFEGYNENNSTKYDEYYNKFTNINFSCFYGKTPQEILDIIEKLRELKDTKDTIEKLIELDLYNKFWLAMKTIASEIESDWNIRLLGMNGLTYYRTKSIRGKLMKLHPACKWSITNKRWDKGISFGVVKWSHINMLKDRYNFFSKEDYNEYMEKVKSIDFCCFRGKTPQEIVDKLDKID